VNFSSTSFKSGVISVITGSLILIILESFSLNSINTVDTIPEKWINKLSDSPEIANQPGYRSIAAYNDGFIAVGSNGRIDIISGNGKVTKTVSFSGETFNSVYSAGKLAIVAGDGGILRSMSADGLFKKIESGTIENINSITLYKEKIIGACNNGQIIAGKEGAVFKTTNLNLKGNIVSVSSGTSDCYCVTDKGEIIHSIDGSSWKITDFNEAYAGYYKPATFSKVLVTGNRIAVIGTNIEKSPVAMFSSQGNVWTDRQMTYKDPQGNRVLFEELPYDLVYDEEGDVFYLACTKGVVFKLPSCGQCNESEQVAAGDLQGVALNGKKMIFAGANFLIRIIILP
jgi:hypothetical protein